MMGKLSLPTAMAAAVLLAACASTSGGGGSSGGSTPSSSSGSAGGSSGSQSSRSSRSGSTGTAGTAGTAGAGAAGGGADAKPGGSASGAAAGAQRGGSADAGAGATTPDERRAGIDSQLDESLGRFDEQLRREQQRTANERDSHAAARANESVVDATANSDERREKDRADRNDIRRDRSGDLQSEGVDANGSSGTNRGGTVGTGADAKPIPSGADDDIVARRLRRAAETETDPELKEKLWKEYVDYKQNTKASK
jgi:hypothetical protein